MNQTAQRFANPQWLGYAHDSHEGTPIPRYPPFGGFSAQYVTHEVTLGEGSPQTIETLDRADAAFYQSWHTFGLLEAVFHQKVPEYLLLEQSESNGRVMSLENLTLMLRTWSVAVYELIENHGNVQGYLEYAAATERAAYNQFLGLVAGNRFDYPGSDYIEIRRLINYIGCIGETISTTTQGLYYRFLGPNAIPSSLAWDIVPVIGDDGFYGATIADHWCPSTINYLKQTTNLNTLRFALMRGPSRQEEHQDCTEATCVHHEVDLNNYVVRHTSEGCTCPFIRPDVERITDLLNQMTVPVIILRDTGDDDTTYLSVQDGSTTPFVAFSHVWADGLGSTSETGLPRCQVRRLSAMASKLAHSGAFWIDALCVPEARAVRKLAIRMMAETYRRAKAVLVLDSKILASSSSMELKEKMLLVHLSSWMRRLWTFQEAILARELYFQFNDALTPIMDIVPPFGDQLTDSILTGLGLSLATLSMRSQNQIFNITDISRSIRWRSTSRASDETLAIASLLNVSAFELANTAPGERMKTLLLRIQNLPKSIPFLAAPKLPHEGFRWAPSTLLQPSIASMARHDNSALCTPRGLIAQYFALVFDEICIQQNESISFEDGSNPDESQPYLLYKELPSTGAYRCNGILFMNSLVPGDSVEAIAVLCQKSPDPDPAHVSEGEPASASPSESSSFVPYVFQKRLLIGRLRSANAPAGVRSVRVRLSGQLTVRIA